MEVLNDKTEPPAKPEQPFRSAELTSHKGFSRGKIILAVLALLGLALGLYFGLGSGTKKEVASASDKAVLSVRLSPVTSRSMERKLLVNGTVWSWDHLSIGSEVGGLKVDKVLVDEGDQVREGQVLATLQSSILKAQLNREEARLLAAGAALSKSIQPNRPEDLTALKAAYAQTQASVAQEEAGLARARANHQEASENAKRYRWLVAQGAVSAQEADARETQAKVALADVSNYVERVKAAKFSSQQAHERLAMGLTGGRREDVDIARAQKMEIEAVIKQLRWQIEQTVVRAPCSGVIMKRHVHLGDIASNTKTMFEIVRDGRLELKAQVPEQDLSQVKPGQTVEMTDDFGGSFRGQVREISPQVDQDMRLGTVRIDITNPGSLKPGNFLRGEILVGKAQVLVVPTSCVIYKGNRPLVYLVEDGKVKMSYVDVGGREGKFVEVVSGLRLGDQVVERGGGFLKDGDPVRVLPAEPKQ